MSTDAHADDTDAVAQTDTNAGAGRREQAARHGHHVGETWTLGTDSASYTGLVVEETLTDDAAEWTLVIDADTNETVSVSWDTVVKAEQLTPECPICATAGWETCEEHGEDA